MGRPERNVPSEALNWLQARCGVTPPNHCLLMPYAAGSHGYCSFSVKRKKILAHRYICEQYHGAPPSDRHQAAHSCGNKTCVNPHHLRWATRTENEADKVQHGTVLTGKKNPSAKLTPRTVDEIRQSSGSHRQIASKYGVSHSTVGRVRRGENWGSHG